MGKDPTTDSGVAARFLYHDCDQETLEWALKNSPPVRAARRFRRAHLAISRGPLDVHRRHKRSHDPPGLAAADGPRAAARQPMEIASGHCSNVSRPESLAQLLLGPGPP
jgi:hypothetical protein